MLTLLLTVLAVALVAFVCIWLIDYVGLPYPANMIAKAIVVLLAVIYILQRAGLLAGIG